MPMSDAKKRANKKWNDANMKDRYDRIQVVVPKGQKDIIKAAADKAGESVNEYIKKSIDERMEREGSTQAGVISIPPGGSEATDGGS